jgi:hypothetical protein
MRQSSAELEKLQAAFHWRGLPAILPSTFVATIALVSAPAASRAEGVAELIFWPVDVPPGGIAELCVVNEVGSAATDSRATQRQQGEHDHDCRAALPVALSD